MDEQEKIADLERRLKDAEKYLAEAGEIQRSILPEASPYMEGYDISAMMRPAKGVGGDFYDYIPVFSGPDTIGIFVGDVSDKGIPAALYMAMIHGMVHAGLSLKMDFTAEKFLVWLNLQLLEVSKGNMFVTLTYGVLDSKKHQFRYARAGHTHPYVFDAEGMTIYCGEDSKPGQPLGILPNPSLDVNVIELPRNSIMALYSDGLTDETNHLNRMFGMERLERLIIKNRSSPSDEICSNIMDEMERYRHGTAPDDDCTIMIIKREG